ncbi:hypothetical protein GCM10010178_92000 [Lentzea flava]|uniref:Uncharacterized protein n=1 Tax=Lentzea flava TaxID=103732 RepID=A0ABQ2VHY4_9PSEU|nr:hypothetical protein GCM10010178_92000 [Lentzea flava]
MASSSCISGRRLREDNDAADDRRLEHITKGTQRIGDDVMNDVPSRDRDVAMVFQA